jgi:hypothetical protein
MWTRLTLARQLTSVCSVVMSLTAGDAVAQDARRPVVVTEIAGANLYLSQGTEAGIATGDTLQVYRDRDGGYAGAFLVVAASGSRAVVVFAGDPFPVTRGIELWVAVDGGPPVGPPAAPSVETVSRRTPRRVPRVHGRFSLDFSGLQSTTRWLSNDWQESERWFATPSASLRLTAANLPGGLVFRTSARGSYRYSDPGIVDPEVTTHVYEMSLGNAPGTAPVAFVVGRFASPYEIYSGYWDGALVRVGGHRAGIGVAAGFQPRRFDQAPATDMPKYSVFADLAVGGRQVRYRTDLSFHHVLPTDDALADQMFAGWSQTLAIAGVRLSTDLRVDRDKALGEWNLARLQVTGVVPVAPGLYVRGRVDRSRPIQLVPTGEVPSTRDRGSLGIGLAGRAGAVSLDAGLSRFAEGTWANTYGGSFSLTHLGVLGLGAHGGGSYWVFNGATSVRATGGVTRSIGRGVLRGSYEFSRSAQFGPTIVTHAGVFGITVPLARALYVSLQGRTQWGENLRANALYMSLWRSF